MIHWETAHNVLECLQRKLEQTFPTSIVFHRAGENDELEGVIHVYDTPYEFRLYRVMYNAHFVFALCQHEGDESVVYSTWSMGKSEQSFCSSCLRVVPRGEACGDSLEPAQLVHTAGIGYAATLLYRHVRDALPLSATRRARIQ